ncbi:MAG: Hsp20/alpha crystallin family protein [Chloroflexi bacterium]|nr:Hsp20/alpha crystallin family protein [Chloroflexota bacterium]
MTLYIQPYRFASPFRRMARHAESPSQPRALGVNVREEDDAYVLYALVPGLKAEDLNIQVIENRVHIEGEYKDEETPFLLNELPRGAFRRSLRMPSEINADKVEARIADGVLTLTLPKAESAKPKKIKVTVR